MSKLIAPALAGSVALVLLLAYQLNVARDSLATTDCAAPKNGGTK